jgi:hypothetical protein
MFTFCYIIIFWSCIFYKYSEYELKSLGILAGGRSRPQEDKEEKRENIPLQHTQQGSVSNTPIGLSRDQRATLLLGATEVCEQRSYWTQQRTASNAPFGLSRDQ